MIEDPGQHGLIRLKAAQLASELAKEIFRTSEEGVIKVKDRVKSDLSDWNMNFGLRNYLMYRDPKTGEIRDVDDDYEIEEPRTVAEWKKAYEIMQADPEGRAKAEKLGMEAEDRLDAAEEEECKQRDPYKQ